jgi:hypothetical protein
VVRKSRLPLTLSLVLALGSVGGVAVAGAAGGGASAGSGSDASATPLQGKPDTVVELLANAKPRKLPRKKFRNITSFTSVGHDNADGSPGVPKYTKALFIDFGKNVRFRLAKAAKCSAEISGTSTAEARQLCPAKSIIGTGEAHVRLPGNPPFNVTDVQTLAISGPGKNGVRFHAWSPTLGSAVTQVIPGTIRQNAPGKAYNWRLSVPEVPLILGGAGSNTLFGVTIPKKTGVIQARCQAKKFQWRGTWVFEDNSRGQDTKSQRCKRR